MSIIKLDDNNLNKNWSISQLEGQWWPQWYQPLERWFYPTTTTSTKLLLDQAVLSTNYKVQDDRLLVVIDVPGVEPVDLIVEREDRALIVVAERDGRKFTSKNVINEAYDLTLATSSLRNGVLTVEVPKCANALKKRIDIVVK